MVLNLPVQHVSGFVTEDVVEAELLDSRVAIDVFDESDAEDIVDAELLDSHVAIDVVDEASHFEIVSIDDEAVPRRLEYAPLGALIAIKSKIPYCKIAQLIPTSSARLSPVAKQSQPAFWP